MRSFITFQLWKSAEMKKTQDKIEDRFSRLKENIKSYKEGIFKKTKTFILIFTVETTCLDAEHNRARFWSFTELEMFNFLYNKILKLFFHSLRFTDLKFCPTLPMIHCSNSIRLKSRFNSGSPMALDSCSSNHSFMDLMGFFCFIVVLHHSHLIKRYHLIIFKYIILRSFW